MQKTYHVKKGDKVVVNTGSWKGETATVVAILKKKNRVVIEIAKMTPEKQDRLGKKTVSKTRQNPNGGMVERSVSVHVSNVAKVAEVAAGDKQE
ncbi:MAG: KOW motif-containing protein [Victivallaceae bacterium]|jgi:large subunit ribosomal protein L24|nr:KOW motif-containing protein [Victivallaceae bacterium]